jgi:hypothetical protein
MAAGIVVSLASADAESEPDAQEARTPVEVAGEVMQ